MSVLANILDPIHDSLPPEVWDDPGSPKPKLKEQHRKWISATVTGALTDAGYTHVEEWLSLVLTGSLTTYQYSKESDCDVSLFVDAEHFPEWSRAEMIGIMIDRVDGHILPGTTYPMQCFVVDTKVFTKESLYQKGLRSGYDLAADAWIEPPDRSRVHDVEREMNIQYVLALEAADKMERLLRYEPDKAIMYWHQLHARRRKDQMAGKGDYSDSNIIYKFLANRGLFPEIAELSGEYIAATKEAWGPFKKEQPVDPVDQKRRDVYHNEMTGVYDAAYQFGSSPYDVYVGVDGGIGPRRFGVPAEKPERQTPWLKAMEQQHQRYDTSQWDSEWHQGYQAKMRQKYEADPHMSAQDYEDWWDWYSTHAPQHVDPEGTRIWDQSHLGKTARPQDKQVAKFVYDPIDNKLLIGKMATEEGAVESHFDLAKAAGFNLNNGLLFGQINKAGHVEMFTRPQLTGFGTPPMNQYEADWRLNKALKLAVPGATISPEAPLNPKWEQAWTQPEITYLGQRPELDATNQPPTQEGSWVFSNAQASVLRS